MCCKSKCVIYLTLLLTQILPISAQAEINFQDAFSRHSAIMLLIDPDSGKIVDANQAASQFYGYPINTLRSMSIQQINTLTPAQVAKERQLAQKEGRNYFIFRHQLADGRIRTVEAHSIPVNKDKRPLLFSVISDISEDRQRHQELWHYQENLEEMVAIQTADLKNKNQQIITTMGASIAVLVLFLLLLLVMNKKNIESKRRAEDQEATLNAIFDNITDAIIYADLNRKVVRANNSTKLIFGYDEDEVKGSSTAIFYADIEDFRYQGATRFSPDAEPTNDLYELPYKRKSGDVFIGETQGSVIKNAAGDSIGVIGVVRDITERKNTEEDLRRAASVFSNASEGIIIASPSGTILDVNDAYSAITGYSREEALGNNPRMLQSGLQSDGFYQTMWEQLLKQGHWEGEIYNRHKKGHTYLQQLSVNAVTNEFGKTQCYIGLFYDITLQKEHENQLNHIAHYDALTNLPNRLLLADRLQQGMLHADRKNDRLAVVYIDLDGFKEINDTHGHDVGDKLLVEVANRMKKVLREGDTVARLGGDEFVAVFTELTDTKSCLPLIERVLQAIANGINVDDSWLYVTASMGVAFYPAEDASPDTLMRQADQAMYQAKLQGKNCYHIFNPVHDRLLKGQHEKIERLQQALAEEEFVLHYQPKVNMRSGKMIGVEALIRWQHPEEGLLLPAAFLPDIENHALHIEVGKWVINSALRQLSAWQDNGLKLSISINVSALQLQEESFAEQLQQLLDRYPTISPDNIELEILESSALQDLQQVSQTMKVCSGMGIKFSLDDFGTGYSSLTYLKNLPVRVLKIDRSFVHGMLTSQGDLAIIKGILGLAEAYRHDVVAEGVETPKQAEVLLQLGCDIAQGFGIAKPMPAAEINNWAQSWRPSTTGS